MALRSFVMPLRARINSQSLPTLSRMYAAADAASADEVQFRSNGAVREIVLNRPKKLNAINENMVDLITPRLLEWLKSDAAGVTVLRGAGGKALSAGGDVTSLALGSREMGLEKGGDVGSQYFRREFSLNHLIATYPKPYVAVMDGIVMGGGVGVSAHGSFRIGSEKTMLAMPETTIGYYPDVGGLFFLSRLDGQLGLYLALTSARLTGWDAYLNRAVTHFIPSEKISAAQERLQELTAGSSGTGLAPDSKEYFALVNSALEDFTSPEPPADYKPTFTKQDRELIDEAFSHDDIDRILASLDAAGTEFASKTKTTILERCPTSVKVTLAAYRLIAKKDILSSFELEEKLADHFSHHVDFMEGVLALLVEKRKPSWSPPTLAEVTNDQVQKFLSEYPGASEKFGHIPFHSLTTFTDYPHQFGLPSENDIKKFVTGETSPLETKATRQDVIQHFSGKRAKVGLEQRLDDVLSRKTRPDSSDAALLDWVY